MLSKTIGKFCLFLGQKKAIRKCQLLIILILGTLYLNNNLSNFLWVMTINNKKAALFLFIFVTFEWFFNFVYLPEQDNVYKVIKIKPRTRGEGGFGA